MKRLASLLTIFVLALAGITPLLAEGPASQTTLKGWIADSYCGAKNANAEGAACTKACYKNGATLVLVSGGKTYAISDQKAALELVGHEVAITGVVENDAIKVTKIEAADVKKKA